MVLPRSSNSSGKSLSTGGDTAAFLTALAAVAFDLGIGSFLNMGPTIQTWIRRAGQVKGRQSAESGHSPMHLNLLNRSNMLRHQSIFHGIIVLQMIRARKIIQHTPAVGLSCCVGSRTRGQHDWIGRVCHRSRISEGLDAAGKQGGGYYGRREWNRIRVGTSISIGACQLFSIAAQFSRIPDATTHSPISPSLR